MKLTSEQIERKLGEMQRVRQQARTDLEFLCTAILGYRDVCREVHGEILDHLQQFKGGTDEVLPSGNLKYTPTVPLEKLEGPRSRLILWPRGHLKTTIATIAHSVQWIINYADVRILLGMAIGDQVTKVISELKGHFQSNNKFRYFFPEFCPPAKRSRDWGTQESFTVECRTKPLKEPTVSVCTVGKTIAGMHYDVIKSSDLVDKENVKTPAQIADVKSHFGYLEPLLERYESEPHHGWKDVEGTIYDFGDLHAMLAESSEWLSLVQGATIVRGKTAEGGRTIWMRKFPPEELERIRNLPEMTAAMYSAQYELKPIPPEGALCSRDELEKLFIPRAVLNNLFPSMRIHCTIDLASIGGTAKGKDSDFTVLNAHGFLNGRLYVLELHRGRFMADRIVELIFSIYRRYPFTQFVDFKLEKGAQADGLMTTLRPEAERRRQYPMITLIPRSTQQSKQDRIRMLQPWFKNQRLRFADDLPNKEAIFQEVLRFPSQSAGVHDDFLDTMADALQNAEGELNSDVMPSPQLDPAYQFGLERPRDRFIGFREDGSEEWLFGNDAPVEDRGWKITGIL